LELWIEYRGAFGMAERYQETPQERRTRYLRLAREAKELAAKSKSLQMREACLAMAQSWLALASELDAGRIKASPPWVSSLDGASGEGAGSFGVSRPEGGAEPSSTAQGQR
jgi:hypothetical protein